MYKLDDEFLAQLGLSEMPAEQKQAFLQHIYSELEVRVGEKLTENMTDAQLDEFGVFVDKNEAGVRQWFATNLPNYVELPDYKMAVEKAGAGANELAVLADFGATKWLEKNRPDYPQVVGATLESLKQEIIANKDQIVGQI
jgi:hypothetical protein